MGIDLNQFRSAFFEEALEVTAGLEQSLLQFNCESPDNEKINQLFRAVHTIKGNSLMFGFTELGDFAHSLETLLDESDKSSSPIAGRVDSDRLGLMGFSYGGAGTVLAANALGSRVRSAITLCAFNPKTSTNPIPMLFVTGTKDTVASPSKVLSAFRKFETSMPKAFARFNNLAHGDITNGGRYHETIARYTTAWSQVFLADIPAYDTYISGEEVQKQVRDTTVFAQAADYIYEN